MKKAKTKRKPKPTRKKSGLRPTKDPVALVESLMVQAEAIRSTIDGLEHDHQELEARIEALEEQIRS